MEGHRLYCKAGFIRKKDIDPLSLCLNNGSASMTPVETGVAKAMKDSSQ